MTADNDTGLSKRAAMVIPGGIYGHMNVRGFSDTLPQYMVSGQGCRLTDTEGKTYLDFMCGWGPVVLGHRHPKVQRAVERQIARGDCLNGSAPVMVELAELLVDTIAHADWALLAKNGTDATTACLTIARAATGRRKVLMARGAYHGAVPWCTPVNAGVTHEDRAHLDYFEFNDLSSVYAAADRAGEDLAAIIVCPFRHDVYRDQELVDLEFARGLRTLCDRTGAVLILDDVRCGFRLALAGSWEPLGVRPDLSAWSKAIANGYALAAVTGTDALREAATQTYVTGSFWFSAVSMAAGIATITELRDTDALQDIWRAGERLRHGLATQARAHGFEITQSGPVQMPLLHFAEDDDFALTRRWCDEAGSRGVYVHPYHNWFLSAAHTNADIDEALQRTDAAFESLLRSR
ncbi:MULTISPECIES: aminotransferase class III-fold pyridoxal phosphate-dependent enzyme [Mycobacteroides]|jgi:glutamate-1-semialdehyde 2,1-aminomutase|uniref:Aminotransferase class III-fold pyridoxal phosphate-dependent enzyme n=1 Tax=Mycobacteroides chelonae TaxID=1774 RepID=A0A1S1LP02_MYCCH|nr:MULTISPECIES: aminotransferase class III-fold pyridoxal phosphate-dependent enzyme [Mycobacteroides]KRQ25918.1 glutamate-1-semialdehyde 2,1-aminomutase [Mycobacteroides sp. H003]KRQ35043.1 glutamate-1-semialdehyde 2,1-aminomutase [Mycobacteroides sp. H092]KRQ39247.1 glutamate-1-semialdehyde 2,1-aminomutase [Mycobacteroides sp. H101]KRQ48623.1 glutamate-1-semialdehyde 2,1-aminomutase [Mycobacteroides sp. H063]KRQ58827.1 glutamate-1-semialdehyde 2,1-aminomutase [Mycobacteroides sp. HXVII]